MVDKAKRRLKGSPYRDAYKQWHKLALPSGHYGCDIDFLPISFRGSADNAISIVLDVKSPGDNNLTATHRRCYDWFERQGIPVYMITISKWKRKRCSECGKTDIEMDIDSDILIRRYNSEEQYHLTREEYIQWEYDQMNHQCSENTGDSKAIQPKISKWVGYPPIINPEQLLLID